VPQATRPALAPGLYIVATPIGHLRDITLRALDTLAGADLVLAEDTRTTRRLLDAYGLTPQLSAYHDHNGAKMRPAVLERLRDGAAIALVSDAGTPLISDPGYKLVRAASGEGHTIVPVPGPSALLAGLVVAGLPSDRFLFEGFLPAKSGPRRNAAARLASIDATLVFYETGPRLAASLADLAETLGPAREAAVARELTKLFETVRRGSLGELARGYGQADAPKGEIVVLVGPSAGQDAPPEAELDAALADALARLPTKQAASEVAERFGLARRTAYQRALALKDGKHE